MWAPPTYRPPAGSSTPLMWTLLPPPYRSKLSAPPPPLQEHVDQPLEAPPPPSGASCTRPLDVEPPCPPLPFRSTCISP